jgi:low temperature requirement protein LtrA
MVGFAIVGPNYKTGWEDGSSEAAAALSAFQTLSLILMASRFILAVQYTAAYCWLLGYKKAHLPLLAHIGTLFIAAMIYLGLYFSFGIAVSDSGLIAWYVTLAFESIVLLGVSARARFMSLRRTAIIERLGLLTLIILGEGIIGLCGSVVKVGSDGAFTSDVVGMVISSVCIICKISNEYRWGCSY